MNADNDNRRAGISFNSNKLDYSLTGENSKRAVELGLAEADWYQSPVQRATMRNLLTRKDGPATRDTLILILILGVTAFATILFWGTWWAVIFYLILLASAVDNSRFLH